MIVERVLTELGVPVFTVPEQRSLTETFPQLHIKSGDRGSSCSAIKYGKERRADLILGTDPDVDRLGIAVPEGGRIVLVNGNQLGALLCDYIFLTRTEYGRLPERPVFIKTIVTSDLQEKIASSYGAKVYNVLTGFKYIAEKIREFESTGESYVFGGEESYGYLAETEVRDKDAVSAAALAVEMTLYLRSRGITVFDRLNELYSKFGYYEDFQISAEFQGEQGLNDMRKLIDSLRKSPPLQFGGIPVKEARDYSSGITAYASGRKENNISLPSSNVLQYVLENDSVITVRPSGTEPKLKFYCSIRTDSGNGLSKAKEAAGLLGKAIREDLEAIAGV